MSITGPTRQPNRAPARPVAELPTAPGETRYFKVRLVKGGPWVPASVTLIDGDRDPATWELMSDQRLHAEVERRPVPTDGWWPAGWPWHPIDEAEFRFMTDTSAWAKRQPAAQHPLSTPRRPIDRATAFLF